MLLTTPWLNGVRALAGLAAMCALTACGPSADAKATMANAASQNCIAHGGHLTVKQTSQGAKGYCSLTDGRTLDEWEYFQQTNP